MKSASFFAGLESQVNARMAEVVLAAQKAFYGDQDRGFRTKFPD